MFYATRPFPVSFYDDDFFGPRRRGGRCHGRMMKGAPHHRPDHPRHAGGRFHVLPPHHVRPTHMMETDHDIRLSLDLPGVKAKDIDLVLNEGILTMSASRQVMYGGVQKKYRVEKTFSVDRPSIDETKPITANLYNGVLQIVLQKAEKKAPLRIAITETEPMEEEEATEAANQDERATTEEKMDTSSEAEAEETVPAVQAVAVAVETVKPDEEEEEEIVVVDVKDADASDK